MSVKVPTKRHKKVVLAQRCGVVHEAKQDLGNRTGQVQKMVPDS